MSGHVKADWPDLEHLTTPPASQDELDQDRQAYNPATSTPYATPDHDTMSGATPSASRAGKGLARAHLQRLAYHRGSTPTPDA